MPSAKARATIRDSPSVFLESSACAATNPKRTSTPSPQPAACFRLPSDPLERPLHFEWFRLNELLTQNNASFPEKLFDLSPLRRTQHTPCGGEELDAIVELLVGRLTRNRKLSQAMIDPRGPFKDGDTGGEVI